MIDQTTKQTITRLNTGEERAFSIRASGKAFKILSSGLYSDKILAIIRELSCNAIDAHVVAGQNDPFLIHLPNEFEPFFSIKDFGIGMSHEDILNIYTTYFESTKTGSNDTIGQLGLGSKSPFSYTDSFTVVSTFDGVKRTYNSFLNEDDCPSMILMNEEPSTEHNGMEVIIAVAPSDFGIFASKATRVFKHFKMRPIVKGNSSFAFTDTQYIKTGTNWGYEANGSGVTAVMGNVGYPISLNEPNLTNQQRALLFTGGLHLFFNIGDLEVTPSRESLSFNTRTKQAVIAAIDNVLTELTTEVNTRLESSANFWQARCMSRAITKGEYAPFKEALKGQDFQWKGLEINHKPINLTDMGNLEMLDIEVLKFEENDKGKVKHDRVTCISPDANVEFVVNDLNLGAFSRCKYHISSGNAKAVYLLRFIQPAIQQKFVTLCGMEGEVFGQASAMPRPPSFSSGVLSNKGKARGLLFNGSYTRRSERIWDATDIVVADGGIYVPVDRYNIVGKADRAGYWFERRFAELHSLNIDTSNLAIIGVKKRAMKKIESNPNWIHFDAYCKQVMTAKLTDPSLAQKFADSREMNRASNAIDEALLKFADKVQVGVCSLFKKLKKQYDALNSRVTSCSSLDNIVNAANKLQIIIPNVAPTYSIMETFDMIAAKYPMLGAAFSAECSQNTLFVAKEKEVMDYIEIMNLI